jgi:GNAT superfamily N-acetyltransferase
MQRKDIAAGALQLREMSVDDLSVVVEAHLESFPGFFLSFLGADFLKLLYESMSTDPEGVVLVAASGKDIEGFVAGVAQQSGFYRRLINKKKWAFARASIKAVLTRPAIAPRLIRALKRPAEADASTAEACLMSIAVRPNSQGKGIGGLLLEGFCREMARRRVSSICLTTDRDDNDETNRFYQNRRFRLSRTFVTPEGRALNEYLIEADNGIFPTNS